MFIVTTTKDQSDGIYNSYRTGGQGIMAIVNKPHPQAMLSRTRSVYCYKSLAPCYNYNLIPCDLYMIFMQCTQSLIEQLGRPGVNANGANANGDAPIHAIVKRKSKRKADRKEKVDLLLALLTHSDVDVNLQNANGMTALHFTAEVSIALAFTPKSAPRNLRIHC